MSTSDEVQKRNAFAACAAFRGSVQNLSHFRLAERHPALAHAMMAPLVCWSFSNSMLRYLLVDHAVPAMSRSLAATVRERAHDTRAPPDLAQDALERVVGAKPRSKRCALPRTLSTGYPVSGIDSRSNKRTSPRNQKQLGSSQSPLRHQSSPSRSL